MLGGIVLVLTVGLTTVFNDYLSTWLNILVFERLIMAFCERQLMILREIVAISIIIFGLNWSTPYNRASDSISCPSWSVLFTKIVLPLDAVTRSPGFRAKALGMFSHKGMIPVRQSKWHGLLLTFRNFQTIMFYEGCLLKSWQLFFPLTFKW